MMDDNFRLRCVPVMGCILTEIQESDGERKEVALAQMMLHFDFEKPLSGEEIDAAIKETGRVLLERYRREDGNITSHVTE